MLHACVQRFDVTKNFEKICKILGTKQALSLCTFLEFMIVSYQAGCYAWCAFIRGIVHSNQTYCCELRSRSDRQHLQLSPQLCMCSCFASPEGWSCFASHGPFLVHKGWSCFSSPVNISRHDLKIKIKMFPAGLLKLLSQAVSRLGLAQYRN